MNSLPKLLSKTKLLRGYRCHKAIYLTIHHPEFEAPITAETQALFDQGNTVGAKAREYFPGGVLVDNKPWDFFGALAKTRELISNSTEIIYEAAFEYMGCYARADVIQYSHESKRWRIFEIKSSTKVKPEQIDDVGLQAWIITKSGLLIDQINLVHLNPECRYPDLHNLFKQVDVTEEIREKYLSVRPTVHNIFNVLRQNEIPDVDIGAHCEAPNECGFKNYCWQKKNIPDMSIFNLPKIYTRKWQLYADNIIHINDPRLTELNELQERIVKCQQNNERYINKEAIKNALKDWQFPLVFLDFETINPAIPCYANTKPFEQIPFQFSVHIWPNFYEEIIHHEFLHDNEEDPRPTLIPALLNACGEQGSIVAYFSQFESQRIEALAEYAPNYNLALRKLLDRMKDPLPIIRDAVYDTKFSGSFSLKKVAPGLLGDAHSYADMLIANGNDAQRGFDELISPNISVQRKSQLKNAMLEYCKKDTYVMVDLVKWLYAEINK